ncbi:MAG: biotin/lipoyl-binding protein [Bacteroidetes bacterium]|nr:biotin/lipoyl-binding protein [Bacteroidota bacterium]
MKKFKFSINGNPYEVEVDDVKDNSAEVIVNGNPYMVEVNLSIPASKTPQLVRSAAVPSTDTSAITAKTASPSAPKGSGNIKSPLPGTILAVHVNVGDAVRFGQKLITLEAMKMENNINSDKEGNVTQIKVNKGDNVMEGDILIVIM